MVPGFCMNMNGFIAAIGDISAVGCGGIVSGGTDTELVLAVGGGLGAGTSSGGVLAFVDGGLEILLFERILASSSGVTRGVGRGLLTHKESEQKKTKLPQKWKEQTLDDHQAPYHRDHYQRRLDGRHPGPDNRPIDLLPTTVAALQDIF